MAHFSSCVIASEFPGNLTAGRIVARSAMDDDAVPVFSPSQRDPVGQVTRLWEIGGELRADIRWRDHKAADAYSATRHWNLEYYPSGNVCRLWALANLDRLEIPENADGTVGNCALGQERQRHPMIVAEVTDLTPERRAHLTDVLETWAEEGGALIVPPGVRVYFPCCGGTNVNDREHVCGPITTDAHPLECAQHPEETRTVVVAGVPFCGSCVRTRLLEMGCTEGGKPKAPEPAHGLDPVPPDPFGHRGWHNRTGV